ncbi:hypothetical protein [Clostridium sp.]|uniref:hypothetical protein n=1 Tax=Clostridium sp. TaxID=1506 RepID=UPI003F322BCB
MNKRIELKFNNSITRLAGNEYGQDIYNKQVKDEIDFQGINIIVIPRHIEDIAISFVQGFICEILNHISKDEFNEHFVIEANEKIVNKFKKSVYF